MEDKLNMESIEIFFERGINEITFIAPGVRKTALISFNAEELDILIPWLQAKRAEM